VVLRRILILLIICALVIILATTGLALDGVCTFKGIRAIFFKRDIWEAKFNLLLNAAIVKGCRVKTDLFLDAGRRQISKIDIFLCRCDFSLVLGGCVQHIILFERSLYDILVQCLSIFEGLLLSLGHGDALSESGAHHVSGVLTLHCLFFRQAMA